MRLGSLLEELSLKWSGGEHSVPFCHPSISADMIPLGTGNWRCETSLAVRLPVFLVSSYSSLSFLMPLDSSDKTQLHTCLSSLIMVSV